MCVEPPKDSQPRITTTPTSLKLSASARLFYQIITIFVLASKGFIYFPTRIDKS